MALCMGCLLVGTEFSVIFFMVCTVWEIFGEAKDLFYSLKLDFR